MEKTFLGMKKNIDLGLSWLLFPFAIVTLAIENEKLTKEEKAEFICPLIVAGVGTILSMFSWIPYVGIVFGILGLLVFLGSLVIAILFFAGKDFKVPFVFDIANSFVKEDNKKEIIDLEDEGEDK